MPQRNFVIIFIADSRFTQQELPANKPIITPNYVIITFLLISTVFIPFGISTLRASQNVVEIVHQYDTECIPAADRNDKVKFIKSSADKSCNITIEVPKHMKQPIYIYYELHNFYQNYRRYVKSRSDSQLRSPDHERNTNDCGPEDTLNNEPIVPCGLIAWSMFNDTFTFSRNNDPLGVNKKGISWESDREYKFGKNVYPKNFQKGSTVGGASLNSSTPLSEQEDLIVWMRTAALPNFRKLYGKIEVDLKANDKLNVMLENNYNTYSFDGKKMLVLSTTSWLGGKNNFFGMAYLIVGGMSSCFAFAFMVLYLLKPRQLGDPSYLSWNRNATGN